MSESNLRVEKNGIGTAGFVLSLCAIFLSWFPVVNWILWVLGLVFSGIGMGRKPKGLATAGLVLSLVGFVLMILIASVFIGSAMSV